MKKILVTGGTGLVGKALQRIMPEAIYISRKDYNLFDVKSVWDMFAKHSPTHVVHLAAIVSGITENISKPYDHFTDNVMMNTIMVGAARELGAERFIGMLSTCAYPDIALKYPMTIDMLHDGPPAQSNFSYGFAKRAMAVQIDACNKQAGTKFSYMIPCNLYGLDDKYGDNSHFIAALIKKIHHAKINGHDHIELMGDGKPLRQFMFADDLACTIKYFIDNDISENVNVCPEDNYSISDIAHLALFACGAQRLGINYNTSLPSGQHRKDADNKRILELMPEMRFTPLLSGIEKSYKYYVKNIYSESQQ